MVSCNDPRSRYRFVAQPRPHHDLKNLFKGAAIVASSKPGPFQEFYAALLAKGMRPEMARLTLARKIATIALIVWKKGVCFDAQYLKPQTAWCL